ncbi:LOG family protein, partial [Streptococcus anginosus]
VYGGGRTGLMGTIATAASQSGSQVIGIIPLVLVEAEVANYDIHHLEVVDTINQRKEKLMELADAMIVFPGGLGTMEELFDSLV